MKSGDFNDLERPPDRKNYLEEMSLRLAQRLQAQEDETSTREVECQMRAPSAPNRRVGSMMAEPSRRAAEREEAMREHVSRELDTKYRNMYLERDNERHELLADILGNVEMLTRQVS